tara:strand:+ start:139 stop:309 length:171 start_codon:yes stop_codon:yes gene_type:complete
VNIYWEILEGGRFTPLDVILENKMQNFYLCRRNVESIFPIPYKARRIYRKCHEMET